MSDMEGEKPKSFEKFSKKIQIGFLNLSIRVTANQAIN
jgi:hypothetical protein